MINLFRLSCVSAYGIVMSVTPATACRSQQQANIAARLKSAPIPRNRRHRIAARERTGALGAGGTLSVKPSASADASYRIGSRWQGSATVERTIAASQDIYDVEAVPGGWRVGDRSYGDPLKRDGCLDGPYFTRPVEAYAHSCIGEFLPHNDKGTIRFDVTTHDGIQIETLDGETPSITDKNTATAAMRAKLAAICVERALADNDELILYSVAAVCRNADDRAPPPDGETSV
jgi:hypothetical protein